MSKSDDDSLAQVMKVVVEGFRNTTQAIHDLRDPAGRIGTKAKRPDTSFLRWNDGQWKVQVCFQASRDLRVPGPNPDTQAFKALRTAFAITPPSPSAAKTAQVSAACYPSLPSVGGLVG